MSGRRTYSLCFTCDGKLGLQRIQLGRGLMGVHPIPQGHLGNSFTVLLSEVIGNRFIILCSMSKCLRKVASCEILGMLLRTQPYTTPLPHAPHPQLTLNSTTNLSAFESDRIVPIFALSMFNERTEAPSSVQSRLLGQAHGLHGHCFTGLQKCTPPSRPGGAWSPGRCPYYRSSASLRPRPHSPLAHTRLSLARGFWLQLSVRSLHL